MRWLIHYFFPNSTKCKKNPGSSTALSMGFIQTGKCPVMTPLERAMTGIPCIWWSIYDKPNCHKILKDLDLKSLLRWSVKTSFSASTLSSLKPVVESMFPGKNKLFSKTSYWHSICNLTLPTLDLISPTRAVFVDLEPTVIDEVAHFDIADSFIWF